MKELFSLFFIKEQNFTTCVGKLLLEKGKFFSDLIEVRLVMKLRQLFLQKVSIFTNAALETFDLFI